MNPSAPKRSYHPFVFIAWHLNFLPDVIQSQLPRSTLYDWHHKNNDTLFGHDYFQQNRGLFLTLETVANNNKLQIAVKMLIRIIAVKRFIIKYRFRLKERGGAVAMVVVNAIQKIGRSISLTRCLQVLQIQHNEYKNWKRLKNCHHSLLNLCIIKHPGQLLKTEIETIKKYFLNLQYQYWPAISIYHQMQRDGVANYCCNTFYKYMRLLQLQKILPDHRRKNHITGIRSTAPLKLLHIDITKYALPDGANTFIYVVKDNYSKAILLAKAFTQLRASHTIDCLKEVYETYLKNCTHPVDIMSDGGPENASIGDWLQSCKTICSSIRHIIAQVDVVHSNSMVEAANYMLKYYGLYQMSIGSFEHLQTAIETVITDFNHRPNNTLNGLTPMEVLQDKTVVFITPVITKEERITQNKQQKCCSFSF
jgi:putative transposase